MTQLLDSVKELHEAECKRTRQFNERLEITKIISLVYEALDAVNTKMDTIETLNCKVNAFFREGKVEKSASTAKECSSEAQNLLDQLTLIAKAIEPAAKQITIWQSRLKQLVSN